MADGERKVEYIALSELVTRMHPENPKSHDIGAIIESFQAHGYVASGVLDDRTGLFLAGHGRTQALAMMKQQGIPVPDGIKNGGDDWLVPVQTGYATKSDVQAKAYIIADNRLTTLGGWNEEMLADVLQELANSDEIDIEASGYSGDDLDEILADLGRQDEPAEDPGAQIDKAAELNKTWQVKRGDVWQIGKHRIMCGDSTSAEDVGLLMDGVKADLVFTDPPFNVGYDYISYDDKRDDYPEFTHNWLQLTDKHLDNGWIFVMNITKNLELMLSELSRIGEFANVIVWPHGTGAVPSNRFALGWQAIIVYRKNDTVFHNKAQVKTSVISDERGGGVNLDGRITDIWDDINPVTAGSRASKEAILQDTNKSKVHHAQMPLALPTRAIVFCTMENDNIYDPFLGSGTTLLACEMSNRTCFGIEIDPSYCAVILQRMSDYGLSPVLVEKPSGKNIKLNMARTAQGNEVS